jgi:glucokinase
MVAPAVRAPLVIGLDVGGTKIHSGLVERDGTIVAEHDGPSPGESEEDVLDALDAAVEALLDERVAAIGYGIPVQSGAWHRTDPERDEPPARRRRPGRALGRALRLAGGDRERRECCRARRVEARRGERNCESRHAHPRHWRRGGIVIEGRLFRGWAELAHIVVHEGRDQCTCGGRGHLEALSSGHASRRVARELYGPDASAHVLIERATPGDEAARAALSRVGESLGAAIGSLVNIFDPEVVVVGGGFRATAGDLVLEPARAAARREAVRPANRTLRIVPAALGPGAGLVGAGLVGFEALDGLR